MWGKVRQGVSWALGRGGAHAGRNGSSARSVGAPLAWPARGVRSARRYKRARTCGGAVVQLFEALEPGLRAECGARALERRDLSRKPPLEHVVRLRLGDRDALRLQLAIVLVLLRARTQQRARMCGEGSARAQAGKATGGQGSHGKAAERGRAKHGMTGQGMQRESACVRGTASNLECREEERAALRRREALRLRAPLGRVVKLVRSRERQTSRGRLAGRVRGRAQLERRGADGVCACVARGQEAREAGRRARGRDGRADGREG
jgi:hypothetical protein